MSQVSRRCLEVCLSRDAGFLIQLNKLLRQCHHQKTLCLTQIEFLEEQRAQSQARQLFFTKNYTCRADLGLEKLAQMSQSISQEYVISSKIMKTLDPLIKKTAELEQVAHTLRSQIVVLKQREEVLFQRLRALNRVHRGGISQKEESEVEDLNSIPSVRLKRS